MPERRRATPGRRRMVADAAAGAILPVGALAVCVCGFDEGQFTLTTITPDGHLADWSAVHADPDNNVCDSTSGNPAERDGTITVLMPPGPLVTRSVSTVTDPVNAMSNPKAIPGSEVLYSVGVANQGDGTVDEVAFVITDAIAGSGCLRVTDIDGPGSGPCESATACPPVD